MARGALAIYGKGAPCRSLEASGIGGAPYCCGCVWGRVLRTQAPEGQCRVHHREFRAAPVCVFRIWYIGRMATAKKKESEFDKLARLIKSEGEDIRADIADFRKEVDLRFRQVDVRFSGIERRLDHIIQTQLDEHASRIRKLETAVFSK